MNGTWVLKGVDGRVLSLSRQSEEGRLREVIHPVLTVQDVCRGLRKSRRQVYRYLKSGRLKSAARILGQWLFSGEEIKQFERKPAPSFLKPFFWDVQLSALSPDHHRNFILARLLEFGDREALRWAFHAYPKKSIAAFLKGRQAQLLSDRARNFWTLQFGIRTPRKTGVSIRQKGRRWGGIS